MLEKAADYAEGSRKRRLLGLKMEHITLLREGNLICRRRAARKSLRLHSQNLPIAAPRAVVPLPSLEMSKVYEFRNFDAVLFYPD